MGLFSKLFDREMKDVSVEPINYSTNNGKFHMVVDDVFTISGKGTVVTGRIDSGDIRVGEIVLLNGNRNLEVLGIEMFRKTIDLAVAGDACGLWLKDISRNEINKGDQLTK